MPGTACRHAPGDASGSGRAAGVSGRQGWPSTPGSRAREGGAPRCSTGSLTHPCQKPPLDFWGAAACACPHLSLLAARQCLPFPSQGCSALRRNRGCWCTEAIWCPAGDPSLLAAPEPGQRNACWGCAARGQDCNTPQLRAVRLQCFSHSFVCLVLGQGIYA